VEKPELEVGTECPIAMLDAVIETLIGRDPSPSTIPATLPNPIHTTDTVAKDGINIQPRVEVVHNVKQNVSHDDMVSKPARTFKRSRPERCSTEYSAFSNWCSTQSYGCGAQCYGNASVYAQQQDVEGIAGDEYAVCTSMSRAGRAKRCLPIRRGLITQRFFEGTGIKKRQAM
jgi:hypothetical protein